MFADDDDEEDTSISVVRYQCMPSLVALQQMRNRLHLAQTGKKLMKWTSMATSRELRVLAMEICTKYDSFREDMRRCFMLLARARYFNPQLNGMALQGVTDKATVTVAPNAKSVSGVKVTYFTILEKNIDPYAHLGLEKGGTTITEAKRAWRDMLKRMVMMASLRASFVQVEVANKNAIKKQNILTKMLIPKLIMTSKYILQDLEEKEREDTFRLKRFKELKYKHLRGREPESKEVHNISHPICRCFLSMLTSDDCTCFDCTNIKATESLSYIPPLPCKTCETFVKQTDQLVKPREILTTAMENLATVTCNHVRDIVKALPGERSIRDAEYKEAWLAEPCNDSSKPCSDSNIDATKLPSEYIKTPCLKCSTHTATAEKEFGFFENKYEEIVKVSRKLNKDGSISEKKQVITVRTESWNPRNAADDREDDESLKHNKYFINGGNDSIHINVSLRRGNKSPNIRKVEHSKSEYTKRSSWIDNSAYHSSVSCTNCKTNFADKSCKLPENKQADKTGLKKNKMCHPCGQSLSVDYLWKRKANAMTGGSTPYKTSNSTLAGVTKPKIYSRSTSIDSVMLRSQGVPYVTNASTLKSSEANTLTGSTKPKTYARSTSVDSKMFQPERIFCLCGSPSKSSNANTITGSIKPKTFSRSTSIDSEMFQPDKSACVCLLKSGDAIQACDESTRAIAAVSNEVEENPSRKSGRLPLCHRCDESMRSEVSKPEGVAIKRPPKPILKSAVAQTSNAEISQNKSGIVKGVILKTEDSITKLSKTCAGRQFESGKNFSVSCPNMDLKDTGSNQKYIPSPANSYNLLKSRIKSNISERDKSERMKLIRNICKNYLSELNSTRANEKFSMESNEATKPARIQSRHCKMCQANTESDDEIEINNCPYINGSFSATINFDDGSTISIGVGSTISSTKNTSCLTNKSEDKDTCACNARKFSSIDCLPKASDASQKTRGNAEASKSPKASSKSPSLNSTTGSPKRNASITFKLGGNLSPTRSSSFKTTGLGGSFKCERGASCFSAMRSSRCESAGVVNGPEKSDWCGSSLSPKQSLYCKSFIPKRGVSWKTRADGFVISDCVESCPIKAHQTNASTSTKRSARFDLRPLKSFSTPRNFIKSTGWCNSDSHLIAKKKLPVKRTLSFCEHKVKYKYFKR